jgi:hypothetical protein
MAPDPYDGSYNPYNPQSLNRYVYADNSPFSYTDGDGELDENGGDSGCELDGTDQDCSLVYSLLAMGAAKECPSDVCHGRTYSGASYDYDCIGNVCNYYLSGLTTSEIINALNQECGGGKGEAPNNASCNVPNNAPNNGTQHSDWWYMYHGVTDQWTADKKTCQDLNDYAGQLNDLVPFTGAAGGSPALFAPALKGAGWVGALEALPVKLSSMFIKNWTKGHCQ